MNEWRPTELNAAEGRRLADEGMARSVQDRAELVHLFENAILSVAKTHEIFCADQVWERLGSIPQSRAAACAMGPAMKRAQRAGWITSNGTFRYSERPEAHRKPLGEWKSLAYEGVRA